jgi:hypothetical protein
MKNLGVVFGTFSSVTAGATETLSFQNAALDSGDRVNYMDLIVAVSGTNVGAATTVSSFGDEAEFDAFLSVAIGAVTWRKNAGSPFCSVLPAGRLRECLYASGFDPAIGAPKVGQSVVTTGAGLVVSHSFTFRIPLTPYWIDALGYACAPSYEQMNSAQFSLQLPASLAFTTNSGATNYTVTSRAITAFIARTRIGRRSVGPGIIYQTQTWNATLTGQPLKLQEGLYLGLALVRSPDSLATAFGLDVYVDQAQIYDATNFSPRQVASEYVDDVQREGLCQYQAQGDVALSTLAISPLFWTTSRSLNNEFAIARRTISIQTPSGTGYGATENVVSALISATDNRGRIAIGEEYSPAVPARNSVRAINSEAMRTGINLASYFSVVEAG